MEGTFSEIASQIAQALYKSNKILLHCHPSPDPDSVGAALAFYHALKGWGKNPTVIWGDSDPPRALAHLPGFDLIQQQNFFQIDVNSFDTFIILDSSDTRQISQLGEVNFPENLMTIVIDHHASNQGYGKINLIDPQAPATCQLVYDLFQKLDISINQEIAACLFLGIFSDSGGFRYERTTSHTFEIAAHLTAIHPDFIKDVFLLENSFEPERIKLEGLALSSVERYFNDQVAIAGVTFPQLQQQGIDKRHCEKIDIANRLVSVVNWQIGISFLEKEPGLISISMRTRDPERFDLSQLALALGGGGHKGAAGAKLQMSFDQAKQKLLDTIAQTYPQLGQP